jgi:hypothetical protein
MRQKRDQASRGHRKVRMRGLRDRKCRNKRGQSQRRSFFREASQFGSFQPRINAHPRQHGKDAEQHSIPVLTNRRE